MRLAVTAILTTGVAVAVIACNGPNPNPGSVIVSCALGFSTNPNLTVYPDSRPNGWFPANTDSENALNYDVNSGQVSVYWPSYLVTIPNQGNQSVTVSSIVIDGKWTDNPGHPLDIGSGETWSVTDNLNNYPNTEYVSTAAYNRARCSATVS